MAPAGLQELAILLQQVIEATSGIGNRLPR